MVKKLIFIAFCLTILGSKLNAQIFYGIRLGASHSIFTGRDAGPWVTYKNRFAGGVYAAFAVSKRLQLQAELMRVRKGSDLEPDSYQYNNGNNYVIVSYEREIIADYWEIPVTAKLLIPVFTNTSATMSAGFSYNKNTKAQIITTYTFGQSGAYKDNYERIKSSETCFVFSAGIDHKLNGVVKVVSAEIRYSKSMNSVHTNKNMELYNKVYLFVIGIGR